MVSISRDNQARYMTVSAVTEEGYNTTLLSRQVETLLAGYEAPAGLSVAAAFLLKAIVHMARIVVRAVIRIGRIRVTPVSTRDSRFSADFYRFFEI